MTDKVKRYTHAEVTKCEAWLRENGFTLQRTRSGTCWKNSDGELAILAKAGGVTHKWHAAYTEKAPATPVPPTEDIRFHRLSDKTRSYASEASLIAALEKLGFDKNRPLIVKTPDNRWTAVFGFHNSGLAKEGGYIGVFATKGFMMID